MGNTIPPSFKTVVLNTGCTASCFEFVPDLMASTECATANDELIEALQTVSWEDLNQDVCLSIAGHGALLAAVQTRAATLQREHASPAAAALVMNLKGDKDKSRARLNPFASVAFPVGPATLVEAISQGTLMIGDFHVMVDAVYGAVSATDEVVVDLFLYDLFCARAVFTAIPAYRTLFEHSAFCVDGKLKTVTAGRGDLVHNLALGEDDTAIIVIAEAPPVEEIDRLFPAPRFWTEWSNVDQLNPLAIRATGPVEFGGVCTDEGFRPIVAGLVPHAATWADRLLAVRMRISDPGIKAIVIAVHWKNSTNLHEYITCITALLHHAVAVHGAELAVVAGDFNFSTPAQAAFVARGISAAHGITVHPVSKRGDCLVTTTKTRSHFQAQIQKIGVKVAAPRIMEFRLTNGLELPTAGAVVRGASENTPNRTWPLDHGATVTVTTLPNI
jgi:hypothetical protein